MSMIPLRISVADLALNDLRERLIRTRWPDEAEGGGWDYGTNRDYLKGLVDYWISRYDWRSVERHLNSFRHFQTSIDGLPIHFVHVRGSRPESLPLILTHGWPSTFAEFLGIVPLLTDSVGDGGLIDSFHLVIPSVPGFGFSTPHTRRGPRRVHDIWAELMTRLGYRRFGACGSDIGATITSALARRYPERVVAIHLSSTDLDWPDSLPKDLSQAERKYVTRVREWERREGAYAAMQSTKPQTLGYGLTDSPTGLAAWIVEKLRAWSDCGGDLVARFQPDDVLTIVMLYWITNSINSANRFYFEVRHDTESNENHFISTPTAVAMFPGETDLLVPRRFAERTYRIERWTDMPRGGHFPALEEPKLLSDDIRSFFLDYRI